MSGQMHRTSDSVIISVKLRAAGKICRFICTVITLWETAPFNRHRDLPSPLPLIQVNLVTKELFRVAPNPLSLSKMAHHNLQQIIRWARLPYGALCNHT